MPKLTNTRNNRQQTEIRGSCAIVWGSVLIRTRGTITVRIEGDNLRATLQDRFEKKESWIKIKNIDSAEIHSAPSSVLMTIAVPIQTLGILELLFNLINGHIVPALILLLIGGGFFIAALMKEQRYLKIYSLRCTIFVFMDGPQEKYQQFAMQIMAIADQTNQAKENEPSGITNEPFSMAPE